MRVKDKDFRLTKQKKTILACIRRSWPVHPTPQMVYQEAKKEIPKISLGTVYRNLNSLRAAGFVEEIPIHNEPSRFDSRVDAHLHFRCEICNRLVEMEDPGILKLSRKQLNKKGFQTNHATVLYFGICKDCLAKVKNKYAKHTNETRCLACGKLKSQLTRASAYCQECGFKEECLYYTT